MNDYYIYSYIASVLIIILDMLHFLMDLLLRSGVVSS
jgi:hypothetical protein